MARGSLKRPPAPATRFRFTSASPTRHDEVGSEDDLAATGGRESVDCGDDWLAALTVNEAGKASPLGVETSTFARVDRLQVGSCAEHRPGLPLGVGLDDPDPDVIVAFEQVDGRFEPFGDVAVHSVACFGAIERDDRDAA
jgi:hypothetical protein